MCSIRTDSLCVNFIENNIIVSHRHHICNSWYADNTLHYVQACLFMSTSSSKGPCLIAITLQSKERFDVSAMLLLYTLQVYYFNSYFHTISHVHHF